MDQKVALGGLQVFRKPLFIAMASGCVALAGYQPALASTSLTSEAVFNFDFTNPPISPAPPYADGIVFDFSFSGSVGPVTFNFYNDADRSGGIAFTATQTLGPSSYGDFFTLLDSGLIDGVFSVGLQSNTLALGSIFARGCLDPGCLLETASIPGTLSTVSRVPEPATLGLLGIAIAGLAATRRKPRS